MVREIPPQPARGTRERAAPLEAKAHLYFNQACVWSVTRLFLALFFNTVWNENNHDYLSLLLFNLCSPLLWDEQNQTEINTRQQEELFQFVLNKSYL